MEIFVCRRRNCPARLYGQPAFGMEIQIMSETVTKDRLLQCSKDMEQGFDSLEVTRRRRRQRHAN